MSAADGLPPALFLLANDSANIAWNLRRGKGFWLSSLKSLLYKNQELTTVLVKVWKKTCTIVLISTTFCTMNTSCQEGLFLPYWRCIL